MTQRAVINPQLQCSLTRAEEHYVAVSNVLVFGAGASHGSQKHRKPPLGRDLFAAMQTFDPEGWGLIRGELADLFRQDFEKGMNYLPGERFQRRQIELARYFFKFTLERGNVYR